MTYHTPTRETAAITWIRTIGLVALATTTLLASGSLAEAQRVCMPHADLVDFLDMRYAESSTAIGLAGNGELLEVFTSGDGGSWTIVLTSPQGRSCVVATGEAWQEKKQIALGPQA